jgi:hypothetical protein
MCSAPRFQFVIVPLRSLLRMASSEESIVEANVARYPQVARPFSGAVLHSLSPRQRPVLMPPSLDNNPRLLVFADGSALPASVVSSSSPLSPLSAGSSTLQETEIFRASIAVMVGLFR